MIFSGKAIQIKRLDGDIAQLIFDLQGESVNKFSVAVSQEFSKALTELESANDIQGLLITSNKNVFIVGADVTEFGGLFSAGEAKVEEMVKANVTNFNRLEDLPFPTLVAINGYAMGGGLELSLACDYRLMSQSARIGLPESKLGLIPGWGGTVRLARLAGLDTAIEWIASGADHSASQSLAAGVVDGAVEPDDLYASALKTLKLVIAGKLEYKERRKVKQSPMNIVDMESLLAFEGAKMFVGAKAGKHYPAPVAAIQAMQDGAKCGREGAQEIEMRAFVKLAQTSAAKNLVGLFLADQFLMKKAKGIAKTASREVARSGVLGAGIMGGGIAYQSALKGVPIKMKDVNPAGLDLGMSEAGKLLVKRVERGRLSQGDMVAVLARITPTLTYDSFESLNLVVEAVVENPKVKETVLAELEKQVGDHTVICSNTSTISIDLLAGSLAKPERFCGMHFFNPVHAMPLVEVIRGAKTSDETIAQTVAYALALGKKPVVVNDCPGFLVNRVLFPYFAGFSMLVRDGADYRKIDKVMERWGWPMGPAYLMDVVGLDTGVHAQAVMAKGFPDRMDQSFEAPTDILYGAGRLGQKSSAGFYDYELDKKGKPVKKDSEVCMELLSNAFSGTDTFSDEDIIARTMVPMALELVRCLEEGIVASPVEADMALIYGLGFPPFRGGLFRWIDDMGIEQFVALADKFRSLGPLYHPTEHLRELANKNLSYYGGK